MDTELNYFGDENEAELEEIIERRGDEEEEDEENDRRGDGEDEAIEVGAPKKKDDTGMLF